MGVDWCRMIPKKEYLSEIPQWIQLQSEGYREYSWHFNELYPDRVYDIEAGSRRFGEGCQKLLTMIDVPCFREDYVKGEKRETMRASLIGMNHIFPAEWREAVYRSYLPEEVPALLSQYQNYIQEVRKGSYRQYLLNWYLYLTSCRTHEFWIYLRDVVRDAENRTNAWAIRLFETDIPEEIRDLSEPSLYAAPKWVDWADDARAINHETDVRYVELMNHRRRMHKLRAAWNQHVPSKKKLSTTYLPFADMSFEQYLDYANYRYLPGLFDWLEECIADGVGLIFGPRVPRNKIPRLRKQCPLKGQGSISGWSPRLVPPVIF